MEAQTIWFFVRVQTSILSINSPPPFTKIFVEPRHWKKNADQTVEE